MSDIIEEVVDEGELRSPPPVGRPQPRQGWADPAPSEGRADKHKLVEIPSAKPRSLKTLKIPEPKQIFSPPSESTGSGERSPGYADTPVNAATTSSYSPSAIISPTTEMVINKSFDSASLSSRGSKRTSISAEMSSVIRQRVRQQAKSIVEKKRGSVQLAKRLLRSQTLDGVSKEASLSKNDYDRTDHLIEETLRLGAKFAIKEPSILPPEHIQQQFFLPYTKTTGSGDDSKDEHGALTVYSKPRSTDAYRKTFGEVLTIFAPLKDGGIEDPVSRLAPRTFRSRALRDFRRIIPRFGTRFADKTHGILGLEPVMTRDVLRPAREEYEDYGLIEYWPAENWEHWEQHGLEPSKYYQLNIDLNRLEFDHHWLFAEEDVRARRVRSLHGDYTAVAERLIELWKDFARTRQQLDVEILTKEEKETDEWKMLELPMYVLKTAHKKDDKASRPDTSTNTRVTDAAVNTNDPMRKQDVERRAALKKCRVRLQLYFNDIVVCKTDAVPFEWDFSASFRQVYALKVFEQPDSVKLVLSEKFGARPWQDLASIYVPFVWEQEGKELRPEPMEFASELIIGGFKNSIGCGEPPTSPFLQGRLFCNAAWMESDTPWNIPAAATRKRPDDIRKFHLIPPETLLIADEKLRNEVRLEALRKRYQNRRFGSQGIGGAVSTFSATQRIPLGDEDDMEGTFLMDDLRAEESTLGITNISESSLDLIHDLGQQYAVSIRHNLLESFAHHHRTKSYQDVVREDSIPVMFNFFGTLFRPPDLSRKLKPMRNQRSGPTSAQTKYKIVVNVQSATNLPERIGGEASSVFVDVVFKKQHAQTATVEGRSANWQETLIMEVEHDNNLQFEMANVNELIELRLYDRRVGPLHHDNREVNTIHEQWENKWLGKAVIPFGSVFAQGKLDGLMNIITPNFSTDYKPSSRRSQLKALLTIDPPLQPPLLVFNQVFLQGESNELVQECWRWEKHLRERFPDRNFRCLATDTNGKSVAINRYIQAINPPPQLRNANAANSEEALRNVQLAAQICSCIPFVVHPVAHAHLCDVWMTVDQILTIGCGTVEEHAVLLCNWLLGLGYVSALVLGAGLPQGVNSAYVYVEVDDHEPFLINPADGMHYNISDTNCPLTRIEVIVNSKNVFGNVQSSHRNAQMEFNLGKRANWEPVFPPNRPQLLSVQKESIPYSDVAEDVLLELKSTLERDIRIKFDQSRPYGIPQWNALASRALREALADLIEHGEPIDIKEKMRSLGMNYEFSAVGFLQPYTTKQELVENVLSAQVHVNASPLTQFALAVHVQPYFNNIACCGVAIASIRNIL